VLQKRQETGAEWRKFNVMKYNPDGGPYGNFDAFTDPVI
jgi:hypothetical protein